MDNEQNVEQKAIRYEQLRHQQSKKKLKRRILYAVLLIALTAVFIVVCFRYLFKIETFVMEGNTVYTEREILNALGLSQGQNLYSFSTDDAIETASRKLPYIKNITINRDIPSTVRIDVIEESATFYLNVENEVYFLNSELKVLKKDANASTEGLIELQSSDIRYCLTGQKAEFFDAKKSDTVRALYVSLQKYELLPYIKTIDADSRFDLRFLYQKTTFTTALEEQTTQLSVYLGDINDRDIKLQFLLHIFEHLEPDDVGKIDVSSAKEATFSPGK